MDKIVFTLFTSWDTDSVKGKILLNISTLFQFVSKLPQNILNKLSIVFSLRKHAELYFLVEGESK